MGKQTLQEVTLETLRPKVSNWKMPARLRYIKEKRYTSNGHQKKLITGLIEYKEKQTKINIWSEQAISTDLVTNSPYSFQKGRLDETGVINFGSYSKIQKGENSYEEPPKIYQVLELAYFGEIQKIIDLAATILIVEQPKQWLGKDNKNGTKQIIIVGDLISKICIGLTMWDSFLTKQFEGKQCLLKGFKIKTYQNSKQLNSTIFSEIEVAKNMKEEFNFEISEWNNLSDYFRFRSIKELVAETRLLKDGLTLFSYANVQFEECLNQTCTYECCPKCDTKVCISQDQKICYKCSEKLQTTSHRLQDSTATIKATVFHTLCEQLLEYCHVESNIETLKSKNKTELNALFAPIQFETLRVKIISSLVTVGEQKYQSHKIHQILI